MNIFNKHITIIGAVRSGVAAAKLAKANKAVPFVSDFSPKEKIAGFINELEKHNIEYETGIHSEKVFNADLIVISPGVPSDADVLRIAQNKKIKIVSELEFASWFCKGKIIGITGTNGKTTTTTLCSYTLNSCGVKTYLAGNIGVAFSDIVMNVKENEYVALEVSSFQLEFIEKFKPDFAVILNITPDHLNRYSGSMAKYTAVKMKIMENQTENDYYIFNADDPNIPSIDFEKGIKQYLFSTSGKVNKGAYYFDNSLNFINGNKLEIICLRKNLNLKGEHNLANALAVLNIAKIIGLPNEKIIEAFRTFKGIEHRLEFVREFKGVKYINDSKATNVDALWYALRSFDSPIYLILGGKDKGNDYSKIIQPVKKNVKKIFAIGSSAEKIINYFKDIVEVQKKASLKDCIESAAGQASKGEIVLLSPACASFDMFENYEHRGKVFKEAVMNLK